MSRTGSDGRPLRGRFPRVSGDEPFHERGAGREHPFSPRERG